MSLCAACLPLQPEGEDDLKKRQLMELAIINGTYRDTKNPQTGAGSVSVPASSRKSACSLLPPPAWLPLLLLLLHLM